MKRINFVALLLVFTVFFSAFFSGFSFTFAVESPEEIAGDINGDWKVSSADYLLLKQIFRGKQTTARMEERGDLNGDWRITSADYLLLKRIFAGFSVSLKKRVLEPQPAVSDPGDPISYKVSGVFSSDMVLQRDKIIQVWGWSSDVGGYIYGEFMGEKRYAQIDSSGEWMLKFSPKEYTAEGQTLTIGPKNGKQTVFENVLVGDVWIVSGQSNAEFYFRDMAAYFTEVNDLIDETDAIRLYRVDKGDAYRGNVLAVSGQQDDVVNASYRWTRTTADTVDIFSAVGYMFVKELSSRVDVPQGIIMAAAGGCVINDFMDPKTGAKFPATGSFWPERQAIYKYFLAPFRYMTFQGILFYQGESDNRWADQYSYMLESCVKGWRDAFDSTFSFYNIQCTSHSALAANPEWKGLPFLRAAQLDAYYRIPNSYLISTVDVGYRLRPLDGPEEDYAHPFDKKTIGIRAANIALSQLYGLEGYDYCTVCCPIPEQVNWYDDYVLIRFKNAGDGLQAYGGSLKGFEILQNNKTLVKTKAIFIDRNTVKIDLNAANRKVLGICYGIAHSALLEEANLVNSAQIPCPTFCFYK